MIYPIYSVKDAKSGFQTPFCDINDESAARGFAYALNQSGVMAYAPKDYDLYKVGTFDTKKGTIEKLDIPVLVCEGIDNIRKE